MKDANVYIRIVMYCTSKPIYCSLETLSGWLSKFQVFEMFCHDLEKIKILFEKLQVTSGVAHHPVLLILTSCPSTLQLHDLLY